MNEPLNFAVGVRDADMMYASCISFLIVGVLEKCLCTWLNLAVGDILVANLNDVTDGIMN